MRKSGFAPSVWGPTVWTLWMAVSMLPASERSVKAETAVLLTRLLPCEPCRTYMTVFVMSRRLFANGDYTLEHLHRLRCRVRAKIEASSGSSVGPASQYSPSLQDCVRRISHMGLPLVDPVPVLCMMAAQSMEEDDDALERGVIRLACLVRFTQIVSELAGADRRRLRHAAAVLAKHLRAFGGSRDVRAFCVAGYNRFAEAVSFRIPLDVLDQSRGPIVPTLPFVHRTMQAVVFQRRKDELEDDS